mmetsp:Transcript_5233/g.10447  ORF Transcript_5233/g.10447 Transcript_5233/m.10447 type:complete len:120 (+) Transcript_5233:135-494(+)
MSSLVLQASRRVPLLSPNFSPLLPTLRCISTSSPAFLKVGDVIPVGYLKDEKDPVVMKKEEYPSWVWSLPSSTSPTLTSLIRKEAETGEFNDLELAEQRRYIQLQQRRIIKEQNLEKAS